jgi:hypothetical protein
MKRPIQEKGSSEARASNERRLIDSVKKLREQISGAKLQTSTSSVQPKSLEFSASRDEQTTVNIDLDVKP